MIRLSKTTEDSKSWKESTLKQEYKKELIIMNKDLMRVDLQYFAEPTGDEGNPEPTEPEGKSDDDGGSEGTFTQEDVDNAVEARLAREKEKQQKLENDKQSLNDQFEELQEQFEELKTQQMTSKEAKSYKEQKEEEKRQKREQQLEQREQELAYKERLSETKSALQDKGLSSDFAEFLVAGDEDSTLKNVDTFQKAYEEAVKQGVKNELSGTTPKINSSNSNEKYTLEDVQNMSTEEINKYWESISK